MMAIAENAKIVVADQPTIPPRIANGKAANRI
jgi:hypothetical protein